MERAQMDPEGRTSSGICLQHLPQNMLSRRHILAVIAAEVGIPSVRVYFSHESGGSHLFTLEVCNALVIHADIVQGRNYASGLHARKIERTTGAGAACIFLRRHDSQNKQTRKRGQRSSQGLGYAL